METGDRIPEAAQRGTSLNGKSSGYPRSSTKRRGNSLEESAIFAFSAEKSNAARWPSSRRH